MIVIYILLLVLIIFSSLLSPPNKSFTLTVENWVTPKFVAHVYLLHKIYVYKTFSINKRNFGRVLTTVKARSASTTEYIGLNRHVTCKIYL